MIKPPFIEPESFTREYSCRTTFIFRYALITGPTPLEAFVAETTAPFHPRAELFADVAGIRTKVPRTPRRVLGTPDLTGLFLAFGIHNHG